MQRILMNAGIMTEANNKLLCTVGGLLVFGKNPEKRIPQNGEDENRYFICQKSIHG